MKNTKVNVKIHWIPIRKNGKKTIPLNTEYYVITKPLKGKNGDISSWSLVLNVKNCLQETSTQRVSLGEAHFLMAEAPSFLFKRGFILDIYEGPKKVGTVEVM